jgi:hypothetical protein
MTDSNLTVAGVADGDIFEAEHVRPARLIKANSFGHGNFPIEIPGPDTSSRQGKLYESRHFLPTS